MREKYGIEYVVVSLGGDGALVVCEEGIFHGKPPKLKAVNTVGCGDYMVGAFAVAFKRKRDSGCPDLCDRRIRSQCNQSRNRTYPQGRCRKHPSTGRDQEIIIYRGRSIWNIH